ncbi:Multidrug resistance-associated protein 1 [Boothiomyces sp. JEL0838]|nr:Multidrug resistance-associated protein 1 [Boothiomyces sp. JEL0838]
MNSFERIIEYIDETPNEECSGKDLPKNVWPTKGFVEIEDLTVAYHSNPQKTVLNKLSASIRSGEKIGVVGRTGSGKSTLAMAFFRILEPIAGRILIDGIDIRQLSLPTLRSNIDIIAQDTNLFSATIRFNLCLDQSFTDEELWAALDMVGMKDYVSNLPGKLEYILVANGTNLSAGQAQLLCLARVIVKRPKILILDEASSSIDGESDQILQSVLRNILKTTTIISIAHRLNTIADFDRILVLDQGQLVEYENPHLLLLNPNSIFSKLVESSGSSNAAQIRDIARSKFDQIV